MIQEMEHTRSFQGKMSLIHKGKGTGIIENNRFDPAGKGRPVRKDIDPGRKGQFCFTFLLI